MKKEIVATDEMINERIDKVLVTVLDLPRVVAQRIIKEGNVEVKGKVVKSNYKLRENDLIIVELTEKEEIDILPENIPLDIVYEDDEILIVNKPSGMVVHPAAGNYSGTLVNALMYHSQTLANIEDEHAFRPGIVHRIDKDTSGLLMVAKTDKAHASLSEQLFNKTIKRRYVAIVHGTILEDEGEIIAPIGRDPKNRKKMIVTANNSKNAETDFFVKERFTNYTLIECQLKTGRTHQIRVHMKYIGHPLVGDPVYGPKSTIDTKGQALHAKIIGFLHPTTNEYMEFEASLPKEFVNTLNKIKGE
jgi:23S rRNA pseudouridine1911/1915/1917 synthase